MDQTIYRMLADIPIPPMARIRQRFDAPVLPEPEACLRRLLQAPWVARALAGKQRVGVTVGSRGISNLKEIVRGVCGHLRDMGVEPFILPSMGSHGGATPEGQTRVLEELGVTEAFTGAKILSCVDAVRLGMSPGGLPVYYDKAALELDGVILLNRIKAHTDLSGDVESGLQKIVAIGLGDPKGAEIVHAMGLNNAVERLKDVAGYALEHGNILFGIGLMENAYDQTCRIEVLPKDRIAAAEPQLLAESRRHLPKFLFSDIDVLIVERIGKNISGDGMDPNIIGRSMIGCKNRDVRIHSIVTLDLTPETGKSALGVGLSDVTTRRIYEKLDLDVMYVNAITAVALRGAHLPIIMDTDRLAVQLALKSAATEAADPARLRVARIRDTLHLDELLVSPPILEDLRGDGRVEVLEGPREMEFDGDGTLICR